jgi:hypothetical protein
MIAGYIGKAASLSVVSPHAMGSISAHILAPGRERRQPANTLLNNSLLQSEMIEL